MKLHPLPAVADNYIWPLQSEQQALVVDPGDAQPVFDYLLTHGLQLGGILITHHYAEQTRGVVCLRKQAVAVIDVVRLRLTALEVPGPTAGHIAYDCDNMDGAPPPYSGGTVFCGGCGRTFEGIPAQMLSARIGLERTIKPFLRSETPTVVASVTRFDARGVHCDGILATRRRWKHQFT